MRKTIKSLGITLLAIIILCGVAFCVCWGITGTYDVRQWRNSQPIEDEQNGDNEGKGDGSTNNTGNNDGNKNDENNNIVSIMDNRLSVRLENSEDLSLMCTKITPDDYKVYGITTFADCAFILKATVKDEHGNAVAGMQYVTFSTYTDGGGVPPDYVVNSKAIDDTTMLIFVEDINYFERLKQNGYYKQICVYVMSRLDNSKVARAMLEYKAV